VRRKERVIYEEKEERGVLSDYVFSFELIKQYPSLRSYIIKRQLKKSLNDSILELFTNMKG
jgi:hypothetical protein